MLVCPGCNTEVIRLVRHHWYNPEGHLEIKLICDVCNRVLGPQELHSSWREQKQYLESFYAGTPREVAGDQVLENFRERSELDKRVGAYLRKHSVDRVRLYRYIDKVSTRLRNESLSAYGLTPSERRLLGRLRKHPRRNKERVDELLYNSIMCMEVKTAERVDFLMRRFFGFGNDSPTSGEFKRFRCKRSRSNQIHRALYEQSRRVREYMKRYPETVAKIKGGKQ